MGERIIELATLLACMVAVVVLADLIVSLAVVAVRLVTAPESIRPPGNAPASRRATAARAGPVRTES